MQKRLPTFHRYSIKDLEQLSNIKAHTLRVWEQRYGMLKPQRTDTNIRYYTDAELRYILNVSLLNQNGFKISKIAALSQEMIEREVKRITSLKLDHDSQINALVLAMIDLNEFSFTKIFSDSILRLGFEETIIQIIFPFLEKIGNLWVTGSIRPVHEHFISNLIRQKLIVNIDAHPKELKPNAKKFLLFTPENEIHELALLFSYYLLKSRNHDVMYIGLNIPVHDLISVFHHHQPDYLLSNFTVHPKGEMLKKYLQLLSKNFHSSQIILSGYQIRHFKGTLPPNVMKMTDISTLLQFIEKI
ncbi:MAG: MerR family transcriptional regulator [Sphingobacteriales bacterium]|jgi:DNA-binding transcriptional MerR regulator|nr:MerR family transcriptional regulator [Sphingobacteriales bacterium]